MISLYYMVNITNTKWRVAVYWTTTNNMKSRVPIKLSTHSTFMSLKFTYTVVYKSMLKRDMMPSFQSFFFFWYDFAVVTCRFHQWELYHTCTLLKMIFWMMFFYYISILHSTWNDGAFDILVTSTYSSNSWVIMWLKASSLRLLKKLIQ